MAQKTVLKPSELKNPEGLKKDLLEAITHHFGRLRELDEAVAARTIRYVVDGTEDDVPLELGGLKEAAELLCVAGQYPTNKWELMDVTRKERQKIFEAGVEAPARVWLRLGEVFESVARPHSQANPPPAGWLAPVAAILLELFRAWGYYFGSSGQEPLWPLHQFEAIVAAAGVGADQIARAFLSPETIKVLRGSAYHAQDAGRIFHGWPEYLARHLDVIREVLARPDAEGRIFALQALTMMGFDFTPVAEHLVQIGVGPAKTAREKALPILLPLSDAARPHVERFLAEGDAGERHEAAQLLWRLDGKAATAKLREHAEKETAARVKQTIEKLLAAPTEQAADAAREVDYQLPSLTIELSVVSFPEEARAGVREFYGRAYQQAYQHYEKQLEQWNAPDRPPHMVKPEKPVPITDKELEVLFEFVEGRTPKLKNQDHYTRYVWNKPPFGDWFGPPGVHLIHVVRLAHAMGHLTVHADRDSFWWNDVQDLEAYRERCTEKFDLRTLDAAVATLPHGKPELITTAYLDRNNSYQTFCDWEDAAIWPAFAERADFLRDVLTGATNLATGNTYGWAYRRYAAFRILAKFPQLPPGFIPLLWDIALGESKTDRPLAQAALATVPGKAEKIQVALKDGRQVIRATAAEWLGNLGDPSAVEPLKEAFRKEKQEIVKGAYMAALDALGADVHEFLHRDELLQEATAGLGKKRPRGMEWVPLDALPAVHWKDTGERVDPRVVQWWVVQSIQQKSPVPGPLLRRYLAMCRETETAALAKFILTSWIGQDTRTLSHEEAAQKARQQTDQLWAAYQSHQWYLDQFQNDKENLYRQQLQTVSNACVGSANDQKGMLALVAAGGNADCVKLCDQYIRKWFGNRLAQCKALVEVLAWMPHPLAIQVLLAFANRFRTKVIRKMAEEHVQALAEREGWTIDELADRTIPDGGFERVTDEEGRPVGDEAALVLDYGERRFTVKLGDNLEPVILTGEGKKVKSPPAPGKSDDPEKAKAAKKAFSEAKKTVKEVVKRQSERLYEALCTQRTWRFEDWQRYLAQHPVVGKMCVRLAWAAFAPGEPEQFLGCFRPLEDGSLTNEKDEEVRFEPNTLIRLAHACNTPAELGQAWAQHFTDYDVEPLFPQFGRETYTLPEEKKKDTDLADFEGHMLTTFKLRGRATKLGYVRGEAEDGGCFSLYRKPFPSLGLQAVVGFTGSFLPEQDIAAALTTLYFTRLKKDDETVSYWRPSKLELGKVPSVLLSECYNDVKQMAADGSGYDPEWQKKSAL